MLKKLYNYQKVKLNIISKICRYQKETNGIRIKNLLFFNKLHKILKFVKYCYISFIILFNVIFEYLNIFTLMMIYWLLSYCKNFTKNINQH